MDKVTFVGYEQMDGSIETFAIIDRGNGEYTSMPKSVYDEQQAQAEHFTPSLTDEASTK
jgi:hypothetical protein